MFWLFQQYIDLEGHDVNNSVIKKYLCDVAYDAYNIFNNNNVIIIYFFMKAMLD